MATPEETIETSAPAAAAAAAAEPPSEEAAAAVVDEISKEVKDDKKGGEDLKATLLISGAVVAVLGAIFAIFKKVKGSA